MKRLYLVTRSLHWPGPARWMMRWKPALNAFAITSATACQPPRTANTMNTTYTVRGTDPPPQYGEQLPHPERVRLQRRKLMLLRASAARAPAARGVQEATKPRLSSPTCPPTGSTTRVTITPVDVHGWTR